jgi:PKD repeat protein
MVIQMRILPSKGWLADRRKLAFVLVILIVILIAVFVSSYAIDFNSKSGDVYAVIGVDNQVSRMNDGVYFNANDSKGYIKSYLWAFGDGNTSSNASVIHQYQRPGWYNVNLTVYGHDDQVSKVNTTVGVQQIDSLLDDVMDRNIWLANGRFGYGRQIETGPNIGNPAIDIQFRLEGAAGRLGFTIWLDADGRHFDLFEETFTATGGTLDYSKRVEAMELPLEMQTSNIDIDIFIWADEGKWRSGTLHVEVTFPMEGLSR